MSGYLDETGLMALWGDVEKRADSMGIEGASVGQVAIVAAVDESGVPTAWQAAAVERRLTVTCVTTDSSPVTGQTVTVRDTDSSGAVVATAPYDGSPVTFYLPVGFSYHVSVSDDLRMQGPPSVATGTIGDGEASVTLTYAALSSVLVKENGRYTNASISDWLARQRDGLTYGVSVPKGSAVTCTKVDSNADVASPVPGTIGTPAVDPYTSLGAFLHIDVNGGCDPDGAPFVTAFPWDSDFALDGSNGSVWVLAPTLYWSIDESGESAVVIKVSDTQGAGLALQPQAKLPDNSVRPYMLYAKYAGSDDGNGTMVSVSGAKPWNRNVSHNTCITQCKSATTGYSGKSVADDWYVKVMFLLKYATKNSQSVFAGCTSYDVQIAPTVGESEVTRVIVSKANAAKLLVGSSMMLGTHTSTNKDRNTAYNYNVFDRLKIVRIEDYDEDNSALYFDTPTAFSTDPSYLLSTSPWYTGSCDMVEGDGSPTNPLSGKEPFVLQGIETMLGMYEVLGDVIISNDGQNGWELCVNHDSRDESTSLTDNYVHTGKYLPTNNQDGWKYPLYPSNADGLLHGTGTGGSTTAGMCDGTYTNKLETAGTREFLGLGYLGSGASCGLWCVNALGALSSANWYFGGRLSATGRGKPA